MADTIIDVIDLGEIGFCDALKFQQECISKVIQGDKEKLIVCEHPSTITLGRQSHQENLYLSRDDLKNLDISVHEISRGGDVTLHALGQLVMYPILDLKKHRQDLHWYLNKLEQVAIDLLKEFDIVSTRSDNNTGAWVGSDKIASIGIGVKKWVTYHGMAVNVNTNLDLFSVIRPCGLNIQMTSIQKIKNKMEDISLVKDVCIKKFHNNFFSV